MPGTITPSSEWSSVTAISDGDSLNQTNLRLPAQALANRVEYIANKMPGAGDSVIRIYDAAAILAAATGFNTAVAGNGSELVQQNAAATDVANFSVSAPPESRLTGAEVYIFGNTATTPGTVPTIIVSSRPGGITSSEFVSPTTTSPLSDPATGSSYNVGHWFGFTDLEHDFSEGGRVNIQVTGAITTDIDIRHLRLTWERKPA